MSPIPSLSSAGTRVSARCRSRITSAPRAKRASPESGGALTPTTDKSDARLALLYEMSRQFCSLVDIDELVPFVIERTKVLLNAESSALLLLDDDRRNLH